MKVKEVEELLQITRANIRFYEKEGLLKPDRVENGYRSYSEEDIEQLKKIILFRKLGVSIPDIKRIFDKEVTVSAIISQNILSLNRQMDEIKGAIDVCKRMEQDAEIDVTFHLDQYWSMVEQDEIAGYAFFDYLKDYIEFEGDAFKSVWSNVFFYNLDRSVKKRGWLIALLIILVICVGRGLAYQFLWKWGSFWYGFLYPFVLFVVISGITLPMYILNKIYSKKELEEEENKSLKRKIPLLGLWKVLGGILLFIMLLMGIPILWEKVIYNNIMGGVNYIITGSPYVLYIMISLYLFFLIVWLYSKHGLFKNALLNKNGFKAHLPRNIKKKVLAVSVVVYLMTMMVYGTWFDCITKEGITKRHFFWTKNYTWEDVSSYKLSGMFDGTLQYTITMKDETTIRLYGGVSSSNMDKKEYPRGEDDFILQLTKNFTKQGVLLKVDSWEKLHKKLRYEYWDKYAEEIRTIAE